MYNSRIPNLISNGMMYVFYLRLPQQYAKVTQVYIYYAFSMIAVHVHYTSSMSGLPSVESPLITTDLLLTAVFLSNVVLQSSQPSAPL